MKTCGASRNHKLNEIQAINLWADVFKYRCSKWYKQSSDSFILAKEGETIYSKELKNPTESAVKHSTVLQGA